MKVDFVRQALQEMCAGSDDDYDPEITDLREKTTHAKCGGV